jgi:hypothetical protein
MYADICGIILWSPVPGAGGILCEIYRCTKIAISALIAMEKYTK